MTSPNLSVCLIVKDEEIFLDNCLKSISNLADEIIIIDTGSSDQTLSICEKYNANVHFYKWHNDFSAARNYAISKATGDWILWIDADEEFEKSKSLLIKDTISNSSSPMIYLPIINYYGEKFPVNKEQAYLYHQPRIFRNHLGIKFKNKVHEIPLLPHQDDIGYPTEFVDAPIYHYGYIKEVLNKKDKSDRNFNILTEEAKVPGHSPWIEYHLANELYRKQDYLLAFAYVNESIKGFLLHGKIPPSILYRLKYAILLDTNNIKEAWPGINYALYLYPDYVDLNFIKGLILYDQQDYSSALECFNYCLELRENNHKYLILKGVGSFKALHYKNLCLEKLKKEND